ncbi:MAG: nucleotidyltransferase family protein [Deltaproteobacteria bacterium]
MAKRQGEAKVRAVILAAGYATRLYPLTRNIPKPLLKVTAEKGVIDFIVDDLSASAAVEEVAVVTNGKYCADFTAWARRRHGRPSAGRGKGFSVRVLNDGTVSNQDRRGAVGDIAFAVRHRRIGQDLLVVGGDNLFDVGVERFLRFAREQAPRVSLGLFDVRDRQAARRFGIVTVDDKDRVVSFEEKPARPRSTLAATCLYYFPKETLRYLREYIRDRDTSNDAPGNYIKWLMPRTGVSGFSIRNGHWFDIGHLDSYKQVLELYNGKV